MSSPPTKTSTPKLSDVARHVVVPKGTVTTGWPAVRDKCRELGISFDGWQHGTGRVILAKRADGKYAATIGGTALSIPRQVGKTFLVGAIVFALCLLNPGLTVIWTAHRLRTAGETFEKMQGMVRRKRIRPHIAKVVLGSGEEEVRFRNGSRILFGARERGFGRGFDEVDVLIFDEAQILTENAIDDMVPATNQSRQPAGALMLFLGTPPKPTDPGEVFTRMRSDALSGEDEDTGYVEFSAEPGYTPSTEQMTAEDWRQIAKANPSYSHRTPREAVLRMRKKLTAESMRREGYGVWDELDKLVEVIPVSLWDTMLDGGPVDGTPPTAMALDASHDGVLVAAGCWRVEDTSHLELLAVGQWADDEAAANWVAQRAGRRIPVVIDSASPAARLIPLLRSRKVNVVVGHAQDMAKACGGIHAAALASLLTHGGEGDELVRAALKGAKKRRIGDAGGWGWDRRDPDTNIAPLVAETLAHYGASTTRRPSGNGRSVGSRRAVVFSG